MVLFLHNRYRTAGGEERVVEDLMWLTREHLGRPVTLLERDSAPLSRATAAGGLLRGGLKPTEVAEAVRRSGARIVHAHNLNPALGWRALAAARAAGARVVLQLHQYRLVCAVGTCFTHDGDCTRCHGRNTLPGIRHRCRGSLPEAVVYAAALSAWQRRLLAQVDRLVLPSAAALRRLERLGLPLPVHRIVPHPLRELAPEPPRRPPDGPALLACRLAPEKGVDVAVEACRRVGVPLLVAGDGPERDRWREPPPGVTFLGRLSRERLSQVRRTAALELAPARAAETFGLAAAEAMGTGLPVVGSAIGALAELLPPDWAVAPGDPVALAQAIARVRDDPAAPARALERVRTRCAPEVVAPLLGAVYDELES